VSVLERFINCHRLRKLIRKGKPRRVRARLQSGAEDFVSIDIALADLCKQDLIAFEDGLVHVEERQFFSERVQMPGERRPPVK